MSYVSLEKRYLLTGSRARRESERGEEQGREAPRFSTITASAVGMEGPGANGERDPSSGTEGTFTAAFIDSPLDLLVIG